MKKLTNPNAKLDDKLPIVLKIIVIPLNLKKSCSESSTLLKGIDSCVNNKVFETDIFKMIIDYKWRKI
jgi:hypothetical protein